MSKYIYNNEIIKNISLNKTLYTKDILRYKKATNIGLIDYAVNFSNASIETENTAGDSILYSIKKFQHRNYKELRLQTFLPYQQVASNYKEATAFNNITKQLHEENLKNYLQILSPTKGGYFAYYSGLFGFIPTSHFNKIIAQSIDIKAPNVSNKLYFLKLHKINEILKPRTLFKIGKIAIQPAYTVNNFNDLKVRKVYDNTINFIFVSNK